MNKILKTVFSAAIALSMLPAPAMVSAAGTVIRLDPADASPFNNGEFEGWGTSLCWWANRVGYSEKLTEQAAEAFFSEKGLSLDIARYNVGGGDDPEHNHITRSDSRVPGVWSEFSVSEDGKTADITKYDITKDQNQLNVAKAAKAANPDIYFEGFSNSPPYFMTNSGCSSGAANASSDNLKADMFDDFAKYIADSTKLFKNEGIEFKSYSPMNEPDTSYWGANSNKQEGCHYSPGASESNMIVETRKALDEAGFNDVLVAGMDETSIDTSVTNLGKLTDEAKEALGRIDTHTYNGSKRAELKAKAIEMNKNLWMSEVDDGWDGFGIANRIIADMNGMQPSAWVIWDIIDSHKDSSFTNPSGQYSEKNTSINPDGSMWGVGMADHDTEELKLSQKYYAFGQFTRYIKPGMTIIASSDNTLAAYDKKTGEIAIVAVNSGSESEVTFDLSAFSKVGNQARIIRTSGTYENGEHWAQLEPLEVKDKRFSAPLKAKSITTFVIGADAVVERFDVKDGQISYKYTTSGAMLGYDKYFAVYGKDGDIKAVTLNKDEGVVKGNFTDCAFKLIILDGMEPVSEPVSELGVIEPTGYVSVSGAAFATKGVETVYTAKTSDGSGVSWSVSDETAASIDSAGKLTPLKGGTVEVTATSETVGSGSMTVTIIDAVKIDVPTENVSGSSSYKDDASVNAQKAADGKLDTFFDGLKAGYVTLDLGSPTELSMIGYAPRSGYEYRMIDGAFYGSNDNETWTELYKITAKPVSGQLTYLTTAELKNTDTPYRYIKYQIPDGKQSYNGKSEDYNCNVAEIEVYGKSAPLTDAQKVAEAAEKTAVASEVYGNMYLPDKVGDVSVTWTSDNTEVITASGEVTRGAADTPVKLTATYKLGDEELTKEYNVTAKASKTIDEMAAYLFVHFVGTEGDAQSEQIYFSVSKNGTSWETLNYGDPVLTSSVGELGVRDPHIIRSPEGDRFFLAATDLSIYNRRGDSNRWSTCQTEGSKSIVIWESENLTDWSEARLVKVAAADAGCTWAPESVYDDASGRYMVFWASKVGSDNYSKQRVYRSYTRDFKNFTEPEVYIEDDSDNIDTTFIKDSGVYYRFTKNESTKAVIMEKSESLDGPFEAVDTYKLNGTAGNAVTGYEGPTAYKINGENKWCLLLDYYSKSQGYKPFMTEDISKGEFTSASDFNFDTKYRHGTVMPITQAEYDALIKKYPITEEAETGEMIFSLGFDDESAAPTLGTAKLNGELTYTEGYKGGKAAVLDGTDYIELSAADGTPLLKGLDTFTVSFAAKESGQSWWFFAAPNANEQTYKSEKYAGVLDKGTTIECERYNSSNIERPAAAVASSKSGEWRHITVVHRIKTYSLYIDGQKISTVSTAVKLSDMLGDNPIAYIGKANWNAGEYSNGAIDDFKVYNYAMGDGEVKAAFDALTGTE